jgi:plastocyanin
MKVASMLAAIAAAAAFAANAGAATAKPKLQALVADPVTISLKLAGKPVTTLKPGAYTIVVRDTATDHDFHLTGPGVNRTTTVSGTGTQIWHVVLRKGTYKFVCDPHAYFMKGSFTVT